MTNEYVLDTNVIISDPYCISKIDGDVILLNVVLEELDNHKTDNGEKGRNIRQFARILESSQHDDKVFFCVEERPHQNTNIKNDDLIINFCLKTQRTLITNDLLMKFKAKSLRVEVESYNQETKQDEDEIYEGIVDLKNESSQESSLLYPNEYAITKQGLFKNKNNKLKRVGKDVSVWDIKHKNVEQRCAIDALLDDDVKLVTIQGQAGTGKTLLAIACALEKTISEERAYKKILIARPVISMGNDIGYLPGDIDEKLSPWMQPIFDNLEFLFGSADYQVAIEDLKAKGFLSIEALTYIRGRSIPDQFIIIDEAQNLSKHEVKTIITRAGEGTKIVFTGDPDQIDNPKLDSINNGLSYIIEKFKDQKVSAHVRLTKCERSELADVASRIL